MTGTQTWWRKAGMALAALILAVLTFGPSFDAVICHDERGLSAAAADLATLDHVAGHDNEALDACAHGHCHHGAPYVSATPVAAQTPAVSVGSAHPLPRELTPESEPKFGLMRPPRA